MRTLLSVHVRWGGEGLRCAPCENTVADGAREVVMCTM